MTGDWPTTSSMLERHANHLSKQGATACKWELRKTEDPTHLCSSMMNSRKINWPAVSRSWIMLVECCKSFQRLREYTATRTLPLKIRSQILRDSSMTIPCKVHNSCTVKGDACLWGPLHFVAAAPMHLFEAVRAFNSVTPRTCSTNRRASITPESLVLATFWSCWETMNWYKWSSLPGNGMPSSPKKDMYLHKELTRFSKVPGALRHRMLRIILSWAWTFSCCCNMTFNSMVSGKRSVTSNQRFKAVCILASFWSCQQISSPDLIMSAHPETKRTTGLLRLASGSSDGSSNARFILKTGRLKSNAGSVIAEFGLNKSFQTPCSHGIKISSVGNSDKENSRQARKSKLSKSLLLSIPMPLVCHPWRRDLPVRKIIVTNPPRCDWKSNIWMIRIQRHAGALKCKRIEYRENCRLSLSICNPTRQARQISIQNTDHTNVAPWNQSSDASTTPLLKTKDVH